MTFHSYGQYILYPWGYAKKLPSDHKDVHRVGQAIATAIKKATGNNYSVGNSATLLYPAAGTYIININAFIKFFLMKLKIYIF